ncbi:MAG: transposase [Planctomycetaceae bacterium]|jgi:transposase
MDEDVGQQLECRGCRKLEKELCQLREEVAKLHKALDEARRAGKRQAAPFRKPQVAVPKKPGRKSGDDYGRQARRMIPEQIDEHWDVPLPGDRVESRCGAVV